MKKTALAILLGALTFSTIASANWYAEGNLGYSKLKTSGDVDKLSDSSFSPSIAIGYKINDWRFAVDYTYYGKMDEQVYSFTLGSYHAHRNDKIKAYGLGFSAYYDFDLNSALKPYVGVRIASNHVKWEDNYEDTAGQTEYDSDSETKFGYGAVIGATYNLAPHWDLNVAAEYNRIAKFENAKINQYGAKAGIRYTF